MTHPTSRHRAEDVGRAPDEGRFAICGKPMDQKGSELDRFKASDGYTVENTRLTHHEYHVADQAAHKYA